MASFEKIDYLLRPSKQVERKLIIEALQKLSKAGYYIHDYTYLGLGSIYYADFILFHKYLLIDRMICAEIDPIPNRMEFNKPFDFIELEMKSAGEIIPILDRTKQYLVWLDYDSTIDKDVFSDIRSCVHVLAPGGIFLISVVSDLRRLINLLDPSEAKELTEEQKKEKLVPVLNELLGIHYGQEISLRDLSTNKLPKVIAKSLQNFINSCLDTRDGIDFFQIFNFRYSDNIQMLTIGGIIDSSNSRENIEQSGIYNLHFVSRESEPILISVPPLTIREKIWLEKNLTSIEKHLTDNNCLPNNMAFEIEIKLVKNFIKYYRHYPLYYETLL